MQGHRRRRATQRSPATPISPKGGGGTASISLSLLLHDAHWHRVVVASRTRRVALATNVTVFMERDTKVPPTFRRVSVIFLKLLPIVVSNTVRPDDFSAAVETS